MNELTKLESRRKEELMQVVNNHIQSYMEAGMALYCLREEGLYKDEFDTFEEFVRKHWGYERRHAYRLIAAFEAADDVKDVCPMGHISPPSERVAREIAKVETPQERADLWAKAVETAPKRKETDEPKVTASHVAKVRKELFGANSQPAKGKKEPTAVTHLNGLVKTIDTVRCRIDELKAEWKPESQSWQTALDYLDEARKAFVRLTR